MKEFLREYLLWILIPFVVVIGGLAAAMFLVGGSDGNGEFVYNVF